MQRKELIELGEINFCPRNQKLNVNFLRPTRTTLWLRQEQHFNARERRGLGWKFKNLQDPRWRLATFQLFLLKSTPNSWETLQAFHWQSYLASSSKLYTPIRSRVRILFANKFRWLAWALDEAFDSAVTLWLECFMAAGLSPGESEKRKRKKFAWLVHIQKLFGAITRETRRACLNEAQTRKLLIASVLTIARGGGREDKEP